MSDEEALLRAVVDAPGDEAPRLVYADWLDERGDARGTYLRAEVELFRLGRDSPEFNGSQAPLRAIGATLDPVWVARVSRPPIGVCCDHVEFSDVGQPMSPAELEAASGRLGIDLPAEYRAFLLNYNGCTPDLSYFRVPGWQTGEHAQLEHFFAVYPVPQEREADLPPEIGFADLLQAARMLKGSDFPGNAIGNYLPIASAEAGDYLLLGIRSPVRGHVAFFRDYTHNSADPNHLFPVANSLGRFLALLFNDDPVWVQAIWNRDLPGLVRWLDASGDPNAVYIPWEMSALEITVEGGHWDMAAELMKRGAHVLPEVGRALRRGGDREIRRLLAEGPTGD